MTLSGPARGWRLLTRSENIDGLLGMASRERLSAPEKYTIFHRLFATSSRVNAAWLWSRWGHPLRPCLKANPPINIAPRDNNREMADLLTAYAENRGRRQPTPNHP